MSFVFFDAVQIKRPWRIVLKERRFLFEVSFYKNLYWYKNNSISNNCCIYKPQKAIAEILQKQGICDTYEYNKYIWSYYSLTFSYRNITDLHIIE